MAQQERYLFEFGSFQADPAERLLRRQGEPVPLTPKVFETLILLLENAGRVVEKERMLAALWPDTVVEEANLTRNISRLRKALGDEGNGEAYIETVPKLGYRFIAEVQVAPRPEPSPNGWASGVEKTERNGKSHEVVDGSLNGETQAVQAPVSQSRMATARRWRSWMLVIGLSALFVALGSWMFWQRIAARDVSRVVAVLPLNDLSPDQSGKALSLGFADVLVTRLSGLRGLTALPLSATLKYDQPNRDEFAIGGELQADLVLTGSVQRLGDRFRLTVRLVDVARRQALWAGQFDEKVSDLLVTQDLVTEKVVEALVLNLTPAEQQTLTRRFTQDAEAQQLYEKGYFLLQRQRYLDKAAAYLRLAIEKDPNFALAYCRLGEVQTIQTVPAAPGAWQLLKKACDLDPKLAEAWAALGLYHMFQNWNWAEAEKCLRRALELKPNYAKAHQWYAEWLAIQRRLPEAIIEMQTALALDPTSPNLLCDLAKLHVYAGEMDPAIVYYQQALAYDPEFFAALAQLYGLYWRKGQEQEAFEYYLRWRKLEVRSSFHTEYDETGDRAIFARQGLKGVVAAKRSDGRAEIEPAMAGWAAMECAGSGEREQALRWIERATTNFKGGFAMPYLGVDPIYDELRDEPRFQAALQRMKLSQ